MTFLAISLLQIPEALQNDGGHFRLLKRTLVKLEDFVRHFVASAFNGAYGPRRLQPVRPTVRACPGLPSISCLKLF